MLLVGFFTPFVYMPPFALERGMESGKTVILVSIIGRLMFDTQAPENSDKSQELSEKWRLNQWSPA